MPIAINTYLRSSPPPKRRSSLSKESTLEVPALTTSANTRPCFRCERSQRTSPIASPKCKPSTRLIGSLQESLLHGMTSGLRSKPHKFIALVSIDKQKRLRQDFDAHYYTWSDDSFSPFVGSVDISSNFSGNKFPGLPVKEKGKIQLMICNAEASPLKIISMHYNIRKLKEGNKVFIRQSNDDYTIHVNFVRPSGDEFYIYGDIKVIFHNHLLIENAGELKRVVGRPSKADLHYFMEGCYLCNDDAVLEDEMEHLDLNDGYEPHQHFGRHTTATLQLL